MILNLINQTKQQLRIAISFSFPPPNRRKKEPPRNYRGQTLCVTQILRKTFIGLLSFKNTRFQHSLNDRVFWTISGVKLDNWKVASWIWGGFGSHLVFRQVPVIWFVFWSFSLFHICFVMCPCDKQQSFIQSIYLKQPHSGFRSYLKYLCKFKGLNTLELKIFRCLGDWFIFHGTSHKVRCKQCNACCTIYQRSSFTWITSWWEETSTTTHTSRLEYVSNLEENILLGVELLTQGRHSCSRSTCGLS